MAIKAGTRITTANLGWDMGGTALSDDVPAALTTWEQWGTETVRFPNLGVRVKVKASLTGRFTNSVDADTNAGARVLVSLDGGGSWTPGNEPAVNVGTSVGTRAPVSAAVYVTGIPSGDIVIKAEYLVSDLSIRANNGYITADMIPQ